MANQISNSRMEILGEGLYHNSHMEAIGEGSNRNTRMDIVGQGSMRNTLPAILKPAPLRKSSKENVKKASSTDDSKDYVYTGDVVPQEELTAMDVTTGFLHIPQDFCKGAFRKSGIPILVFNEYGFQTTCLVEFDNQNPNLYGITEGWEKVTNHRKFFEGLHVEISVPCGNPHLMGISTVNYHCPN